MSFRRGSDGVWRCEALEQFDWLDHGFGSRHSGSWLEGRPFATLKQTHSDAVCHAAGRSGWLGEGDALLSREPGLMVAVRTADCFPVILADPVEQAVAVIHAGWRGVVGEIVPRAVERLRTEFGSVPENLYAAIGPGIGICCFEVGPEVAQMFQKEGRCQIDLAARLSDQLAGAGVPVRCIDAAGLCTFCLVEEFWSFRREGEAAGRTWSGAGKL